MGLRFEREVATRKVHGDPIDVISNRGGHWRRGARHRYRDLDASQLRRSSAHWHDHQVLWLRWQAAAMVSFIASAARFGTRLARDRKPTALREGLPEIYIVSKRDRCGTASDGRLRRRRSRWHTECVSRCFRRWRVCFTLSKSRLPVAHLVVQHVAVTKHGRTVWKRRIANLPRSNTTVTYKTPAAICAGVTATTIAEVTGRDALRWSAPNPATGGACLYLGPPTPNE